MSGPVMRSRRAQSEEGGIVIEWRGSTALVEYADALADHLRRFTRQAVRQVEATWRPDEDVMVAQRFVVMIDGAQRLPDDRHPPAESYRIVSSDESGVHSTWVIGADLSGCRSGVYRLLEEFGCSFHLYGDILPPPCDALPLLEIDLSVAPRFARRGTQLWCAWYPGRDSWGWKEYETYIDQLPKLGLNLFDFPLYFYEPLYTGFGLGEHVSLQSGADTRLVRIGAKHFDSFDPRFVSPDIPDGGTQVERCAAAANLMRRVFEHARFRGVETAVGIEIMNHQMFGRKLDRIPLGDRYADGRLVAPSSESARTLTRARLEALVRAFPDCDYYVFWQSETGIFRANSGSPHPRDIAFREENAVHADRLSPADFDYLAWVRLAAELMEEIKPGARIATAGWGAENLMSAADDLLPPSVIRNSIAHYEPRFTLDQDRLRGYGETTGETWHTTWAETDMHLWVLQPKLDATQGVLDGLERRGAGGASLLHWRSLWCDADATFFAKSCWVPSPSPDSHRRDWARAKYGDACADHVAQALADLERFNELTIREDIFTWVGFDCFISGLLVAHRVMTIDLPVPQSFLESHVHTALRTIPALLEFLGDAEASMDSAMRAADAQGDDLATRRLAYLANRVTYTRMLHESHLRVAEAIGDFDAAIRSREPAARSALLERSLAAVRAADAEAVVELFAEVMAEQDGVVDAGEAGLLLTLNQKFLSSVKRIEKRVLVALGRWSTGGSPRFAALAGMRIPYVWSPELATNGEIVVNPDPVKHIVSEPWCTEQDEVSGGEGFGYELLGDARTARLSQESGWWQAPDELNLRISLPADFDGGTLRVHLFDELGWPTTTRRQQVTIDGDVIGEYHDMLGRGDFHDEGIWIERRIARGAPAVEVVVTRSGASDVIVAGFEIV